MKLANVESLIDKGIKASSGNTCIVESVLGPGGISVKWRDKPSQKDFEDLEEWIAQELGVRIAPVNYRRTTDADEKAAYERFLKETE